MTVKKQHSGSDISLPVGKALASFGGGSVGDAAMGAASVHDDTFRRAFQALLSVSEPSQSLGAFLANCVAQISLAYGSRYAFIGKVQDMTSASHIETISCFVDGQITSNMVYPLCGSPCQEVLQKGELYVAADLCAKYPDDDLLQDMGLESYYGTVLKDGQGMAIGLVVICDTEPLDLNDWNLPLLRLFADRIAHEIERSLIEQELRLSSSVFQNSHDMVLIMRDDWHIMKANRTFETMTGWSEEEAQGEHIYLLRSEHSTDEFHRELTIEVLKTGFWSGELWVKPRNGKIFPADCTIKAVLDPSTGEKSHYIMIFSDVSERKYAEERINRLAYYDAGTDLPNRMYFQEELKKVLSQQREASERFAVMFMDLDGFKAVNDRMGHAAGDQLLREVADRLRALPGESIFAARLGGDEFGILVRYSDRNSGIVLTSDQIANQIISAIGHPYEIEGEPVRISASIGIALYPDNGEDSKSLLRNADLATYFAKSEGRNRAEFFHDALCEKADCEAAMMALMHKGLKEDQFYMVYQSKHAASDGRMVGAEALMRWRLDDGTMISPGQFIPVAEETGQICELGQLALRSVFKQLVEWQTIEGAPERVSINLSGRQLVSPVFLSRLEDMVTETGVNTKQVELEITETWLMEDPDHSARLLKALKQLGFSLSIDDFGVAYSSMNYLRHFPIDVIKIDQSFVRDVVSDKSSVAIISAITAMGHSLGLKVLAEGVENKDQLELLRTLGCDEIQGYYFSRPVEAERLLFVNSVADALSA